MPEPPARLLIADDHALVREGMRAMLGGEPGLEIAGEAANGREAVELARELQPDLILMDVRMPQMDGLAATHAIKSEQPSVGILIVTTHDDPDYLFEAVKAGAAGYVLKDASKQHLLGAIRRTLSGESPLDQELAMQLLQRMAAESVPNTEPTTPSPPKEPDHPLSERGVEVLRLLAQGKTNPEIGRTLYLSASTVKTHVRSIIAKLGVSDRTQAAVRAAELGLLS